jgi:hypothetical protein
MVSSILSLIGGLDRSISKSASYLIRKTEKYEQKESLQTYVSREKGKPSRKKRY